jgi:hypothetical protein
MTAIAIAVILSPMAADDFEADKGEVTPKMPIICMFRSKIKIMGHLSMKNVRWRLLRRSINYTYTHRILSFSPSALAEVSILAVLVHHGMRIS